MQKRMFQCESGAHHFLKMQHFTAVSTAALFVISARLPTTLWLPNDPTGYLEPQRIYGFPLLSDNVRQGLFQDGIIPSGAAVSGMLS